MTSRRTFLQQSGSLAVAGLLAPALGRANDLFATKAAKPVGLQLYSVGALMEADPKGTLQKLAAIGFKELESAGSSKGNWYGFKPKEFASVVKDLGMTWRAAHVSGFPIKMADVMKMAKTKEDSVQIQKLTPMIEGMAKAPNLKDNAQQVADEAAGGGLSYVVCAGLPVNTLDEVKASVDVLNQAGEICKKAGLEFAYHNHHFEFVPLPEGIIPFDYLMSNTDAELVKSELDLGWVAVAGSDPVKIIKKYPGRIPLWHVKDFDKTTMQPVEIGTGILDIKAILANAELSGMKYFFVEAEGVADPLEHITGSYNTMKKLLG